MFEANPGDKVEQEKKAPTVTIPTGERWAQGVPHDERSRELYDFIAAYDWDYCGDFFSFSAGGDGDNGEQLMYLMDEYFAMKDQTNHTKEKEVNNV